MECCACFWLVLPMQDKQKLNRTETCRIYITSWCQASSLRRMSRPCTLNAACGSCRITLRAAASLWLSSRKQQSLAPTGPPSTQTSRPGKACEIFDVCSCGSQLPSDVGALLNVLVVDGNVVPLKLNHVFLLDGRKDFPLQPEFEAECQRRKCLQGYIAQRYNAWQTRQAAAYT